MITRPRLTFIALFLATVTGLAACSDDDCATPGTGADTGSGSDTGTTNDCSDGCLIGDLCYFDGAVNASNVCQICDATASPFAWSDNDGTVCDDGAFCTEVDLCAGGACAGTARDCSDGIDCTGAETCDEDAETCVRGDTTCTAPEICDATDDECVTTCTGCVIDGVCYGEDQTDPLEVCRLCDPDLSATAWSDNDGVACDDGDFCNGTDSCDGGTCSLSTGDPCAGDRCREDEDRCCVPNVAVTDPVCNDDGDVIAVDDCGDEFVADDCDDTNGTCNSGACGCVAGLGGESCDCVLHVDGDVDASVDGTSWDDAYKTVQEAVDAAAAMPGGCAVWVTGQDDYDGLSYAENIVLYDDVHLYGGFAGTETDFGARDVEIYETILDAEDAGTVVTYIGDDARSSHATVDGFTITGASDSGMRVENASPTVSSCRFVANVGPNGGGLFAESSNLVVTGCLFAYNSTLTGSPGSDGNSEHRDGWPGSSGGHGGGAYLDGGSIVITDCIFDSNAAGSGGDGGTGYRSSGRGGKGGPGGSGGGIFVNSGSPEISSCRFLHNTAGSGGEGESAMGRGANGGPGGDGGGVFVVAGEARISSCTFSDNASGSGGDGAGGQYGADGGPGGSGGGIYFSDGSLIVTDCNVSLNSAGSGGEGGGGMEGGKSGHGGHGGGIFLEAGSSYFANTRFWKNTAGQGIDGPATGLGANGGDGGGLYIDDCATTLVNCAVSGNYAGSGGSGLSSSLGGHGGGIYLGTGETVLFGCAIAGNATGFGGVDNDGVPGQDGFGGGIYNFASPSSVTNSIVWGNTNAVGDPQLHDAGDEVTLTVNYSDVEGGHSGTGNIDAEPRFRNLLGGNLHLRFGSPCIDTGDDTAVPTDVADLDGDGVTGEPLPFDGDGNARVVGTVDIGPYEIFNGCGNFDVSIDDGEQCDDGNTEDGDGCSATCACEDIADGTSCADIKADNPAATDGIYRISYGDSPCSFPVYCDMTTDNGGWTLLLRLDSNDLTTQWWGATGFWESYGDIGALDGNDDDYLSPAYYSLATWDQILVDYRYAYDQHKRMAAVFHRDTNDQSLREHATRSLSNDNPPWQRVYTTSVGDYADAANWYGPELRFQTIGNGVIDGFLDNFRIWYNRVEVYACNQAGGIGGSGDNGAWWHELSFPSNIAGCQENTHRGTIGRNGGGNLMLESETEMLPADAYDNGIMRVFVR